MFRNGMNSKESRGQIEQHQQQQQRETALHIPQQRVRTANRETSLHDAGGPLERVRRRRGRDEERRNQTALSSPGLLASPLVGRGAQHAKSPRSFSPVLDSSSPAPVLVQVSDPISRNRRPQLAEATAAAGDDEETNQSGQLGPAQLFSGDSANENNKPRASPTSHRNDGRKRNRKEEELNLSLADLDPSWSLERNHQRGRGVLYVTRKADPDRAMRISDSDTYVLYVHTHDTYQSIITGIHSSVLCARLICLLSNLPQSTRTKHHVLLFLFQRKETLKEIVCTEVRRWIGTVRGTDPRWLLNSHDNPAHHQLWNVLKLSAPTPQHTPTHSLTHVHATQPTRQKRE